MPSEMTFAYINLSLNVLDLDIFVLSTLEVKRSYQPKL